MMKAKTRQYESETLEKYNVDDFSLAQTKQFTFHKSKITALAWGNALKYPTQIVSVDEGGTLIHWDAFSGQVFSTIEVSRSWIMDVDFEMQEGKKVACGLIDGKLCVYLVNQSSRLQKTQKEGLYDKPVCELQGHVGAVLCCKFLNTNYLVTGSSDSNVAMWDLENPQRPLSLHSQHTSDVTSLSVCDEDGNYFLSGSTDLTAKIWDVRMRNPALNSYEGHESAISSVAFLPKSTKLFATGSEDSTIRLYDLRMQKPLQIFKDKNAAGENFDPIYSITFSKSGRLLFAGSENEYIKVWDVLGHGEILKRIHLGHHKLIKKVAMSADGFALASADPNGKIIISQP